MTDPASLQFDSVSKTYPGADAPVISDLSFEVPAGEICVLVGPSGCGKTTTLRMINRLIEPTSGHIFLGDDDVTHADPVDLRRRMGYVIQQVGLVPHQTIGTNVATVPRLLGWERARVHARVDELLGLVGLDPDEFRGRYPAQLSGGQRQRVGVARALAADPPVLLMDEPFGAIDPVTRARLQDEFLRLQSEIRKTIVFVTHDIDEAVKMGDRIAILQIGGILEQYDVPAEVLGRPASPMVADFVGSDRALKRLKVMPITESVLEHPPGLDLATVESRVQLRQSLEDALAAILLTDDGMVAVADGDRLLGTLGTDAIYRALRASRDGDAPAAGSFG